jgi:peptidoglycan/xylan/chitin deacetylase (PgdA/CDA1 family)
MKGIFTISLDFELHWGGFEKWSLKDGNEFDYQSYFRNTRQVIPEMLHLFEQYEVHVTWATVGMLFHRTKDELLKNAPTLKPGYTEEKLSAYNYIKRNGIGQDEENDPFHFAPSLIQKIISIPHQELATHTFSHFYCNEEGQTLEQFRDDLKAAQRVAAMYDKKLASLVFPRNQFNDQYLKVCFEEGITSVRSNPLDWFWQIESTQHESKWKRLNRGLDAYFPLGKKNTYKLDALYIKENFPICIPASRLLRPYNPKELFLNNFKIKRIQEEMSRAAKKGEVYHLWWHPHNFGRYPNESLEGLRRILQHYSSCKKKFEMSSLGMGEIADSLLNRK